MFFNLVIYQKNDISMIYLCNLYRYITKIYHICNIIKISLWCISKTIFHKIYQHIWYIRIVLYHWYIRIIYHKWAIYHGDISQKWYIGMIYHKMDLIYLDISAIYLQFKLIWSDWLVILVLFRRFGYRFTSIFSGESREKHNFMNFWDI